MNPTANATDAPPSDPPTHPPSPCHRHVPPPHANAAAQPPPAAAQSQLPTSTCQRASRLAPRSCCASRRPSTPSSSLVLLLACNGRLPPVCCHRLPCDIVTASVGPRDPVLRRRRMHDAECHAHVLCPTHESPTHAATHRHGGHHHCFETQRPRRAHRGDAWMQPKPSHATSMSALYPTPASAPCRSIEQAVPLHQGCPGGLSISTVRVREPTGSK